MKCRDFNKCCSPPSPHVCSPEAKKDGAGWKMNVCPLLCPPLPKNGIFLQKRKINLDNLLPLPLTKKASDAACSGGPIRLRHSLIGLGGFVEERENGWGEGCWVERAVGVRTPFFPFSAWASLSTPWDVFLIIYPFYRHQSTSVNQSIQFQLNSWIDWNEMELHLPRWCICMCVHLCACCSTTSKSVWLNHPDAGEVTVTCPSAGF